MSEKQPSRKRIFWLCSVAIALAVHAAGLLLFQVGPGETPAAEADLSFVSLPSREGQADDLWQDQASLLDSAPLFFPTHWNAASSPVVKPLEQRPAELFDSFPAQLSYGETDFGLGAISSEEPGSPLENLQVFSDLSHVSFGRAHVAKPEIEPRFALLEVVDSAGGKVVLTAPVPLEGAPVRGRELWAPAEFLVQVGVVGFMGEPVLLRGSGVDEVDQYLRDALRHLAQERMLAAGYYRVLAGP